MHFLYPNVHAKTDPLKLSVGLFTASSLSRFNVIAFLSNSEEILDVDGKAALLTWLTTGDGTRSVLGFHSATAALFATPFFGKCLGAFFDYHPDSEPFDIPSSEVTDCFIL